MSRMIFVNLPVTDLDASMTFYKSIGFAKQRAFHRRYGCVHGMERGDQCHAAHAPQVAQIHEPPHPARNVKRSDACPVLRQSPGGRCHERGGCRERRDSRHQPRAGSWFHVQPEPSGSRRPHLGGDVDGPGSHSFGRSNKLRKGSRRKPGALGRARRDTRTH